ncbi:MAG TPA: sulfite exporter TauE/SafE family protein, partial [Chloroflexota bacterium]|nr:sulfite exporter TauE/SafE family protein [Chloroflexota bacterium]
GGLHALSPGHGKTIVGAYLIGARGTPRHAAILGLTVTLTHTAGVFALGLITLFASRYVLPERLYPWLSALSGLLVAAVGGWLLWVRLRWAFHRPVAPGGAAQENDVPATASGRQPELHAHEHHAEPPQRHHQHAPSHAPAHRHAHTEAQHRHRTVTILHDHGTGSHEHIVPTSSEVTLRGLLALGISGGLLPCPSALVVLLAAISLDRAAFGIVLVLAFSVGLAVVLTAIGLLLVYARGFLIRHRFEVGPGRLLPAASACLVLLLGLGIAFQALTQSGLRLL